MSPADYNAAAQSIYEPQKQAEQIALTATRDTTKNALESEKAQVGTDYQSAINNLTQALQDHTGQINMLYSQRLGGNFSGLQGNDLGAMFARSAQQQSIIEQTRANKLATITGGETNADINYNAGVAALTPKYQSLESTYAQNAYASAVKAQQAQANSDRTYELGVARLNSSNYNAAAARAAAATKPPSAQESASMLHAELSKVTGKDGYIAPQDYTKAYKLWTDQGFSTSSFHDNFDMYKNPKNKNYRSF